MSGSMQGSLTTTPVTTTLTTTITTTPPSSQTTPHFVANSNNSITTATTTTTLDSSTANSSANPTTAAKCCHGCYGFIQDRFYLLVMDKPSHIQCLRCRECKSALDSQQSCFAKDGFIYCKEDYFK